MRNRFIKITLTLAMLLVVAVPTQAFAAEKYDTQLNQIKNSNYSILYNQLRDQFSKAGITFQTNQQAENPTQVKQAPTATPAKTTTAAQAPAATPAKTTTTAPASANIGNYEQQVVDLVNKERAAAGLPALKMNTKLAGVAEKKAEDLRDNNYFDHQSPTYGSPFDMMKQFGITYTAAGENIAKGQKTPSDVMNGWMNSPGHRANILNAEYTEIGVGYVQTVMEPHTGYSTLLDHNAFIMEYYNQNDLQLKTRAAY
jgi:uncharacterized YkwD family protein